MKQLRGKAVTVLQSALPPRRTVTTSCLFRTIKIDGVNLRFDNIPVRQ